MNGNNLMSNIEMRHYSGIPSEEEVLFLPLSCFEVTEISDSTLQKRISKLLNLFMLVCIIIKKIQIIIEKKIKKLKN